MKVIIIGCGRIGSGLAKHLVGLGHSVTVIDSNRMAFEKLGSAFNGRTLEGVGFDWDVLTRADIAHAEAVVAVTSSDNVNAVVARLARQVFQVPKVIARMYDTRKAEIYEQFGIQTLSTTKWGIKRSAELLSYTPFKTTVSLGSGEVDIVEIEISARLAGSTVAQLTVPGEIQIVAVNRKEKTFLPTLGTELMEQDHVYVAKAAGAGARLKKVFNLA